MFDSSMTGRGWSHGTGLLPDGTVPLASGSDDIEQAIRLILATRPGERPMRPEFGCKVHDLLFAPLDASLAGQAIAETRRALDRWEPRITIETVSVLPDDTNGHSLLLDIRYRIRSDNSPRNLVHPFYAIPPESSEQPGAMP